nr:unnamed protein product [Callosobruchus chinensis]
MYFFKEKIVVLHFCRLRTPHRDPALLLQGSSIQVKGHHKILGITFDNKLLWKHHIDDLATKCKKALNVIKCLSNISFSHKSSSLYI